MNNGAWQEKISSVDEYKIFSRVSISSHTQNPPIVLVHGLGVSGRYMLPLADILQKYFTIYIPDFPGHGRSTRPSHILHISEYANILHRYLLTHSIHQPLLVGNSMGCQIIVDLITRYPGHASHAVLIGPTMDRHMRYLPLKILRLLADAPYEPLSYWPLAIKEYLHTGIIRTLQTAHRALQDPIEKKLPHIHIPTLVIRGENDTIITQKWVEEVTQVMPYAKLVIIKDAGHVVNYNSPHHLAHEIQKFLDGIKYK